MQFLSLPPGHFQRSGFGESQNHSKKRIKKKGLHLGILLVGIFLLAASGEGSAKPTFYSFLTKDQTLLTPDTRFSRNDRVSLQTIWHGLTGTHDVAVLWIDPDKKVYQRTRFTFTVPFGNPSLQTSACCLDFFKNRFLLNNSVLKYIGPWRVQLFLDGKFLSEYSFDIS